MQLAMGRAKGKRRQAIPLQELGDLIIGKEDETRGGCINNRASWSGGRQQWELSEEEEEQRKMGRKPWRGWMH